MLIERATPEQAPCLTAIAHAAKRHWGYPEAWIAAWRDILTITPATVGAQVMATAVEGGEAIGFYGLLPGAGTWTMEHLWVLPEWIGRGVGGRLFAHAVETARAAGATALEIEADPNAAPFYRHQGAQPVGEVRGEVLGQPRVLPLLRLALGAGV